MSRILGSEVVGNRVHTYHSHLGDDGKKKLTIETKEDVSPIISGVKFLAQNQNKKSDFRFKCSIPLTVIDETAKKMAHYWGVTPKQAFEELTSSKSDRGKQAMKILSESMDYRKLQAKHYR